MYAIIETGGKQYSVKKGDVLCIEKIDAAEGSVVVIDKVLLVGNDDNTVVVGKPYVEGMGVSAKVVEHGKGDKVLVFKYKPKKKFRKLRGHRQPYTKIEIEAIGADLKAEAPKKAAAPKKEAAPKVEEKPATEKKPAAKKTATKAAAEKPATEKKAPAKKAAAPKAAKPAAEKKPAAKKTAKKKVTE